MELCVLFVVWKELETLRRRYRWLYDRQEGADELELQQSITRYKENANWLSEIFNSDYLDHNSSHQLTISTHFLLLRFHSRSPPFASLWSTRLTQSMWRIPESRSQTSWWLNYSDTRSVILVVFYLGILGLRFYPRGIAGGRKVAKEWHLTLGSLLWSSLNQNHNFYIKSPHLKSPSICNESHFSLKLYCQ